MNKKKLKCETCELKGYNPDFCKWHRKKISEVDVKTCRPAVMNKKKLKCETCELKGYNPDFCKWHRKKISEVDVKACRPQDFYKKVGKMAVLGAGVGVVAATAGLAVVPAVGLKAVIGHALAAKVTAGAGAAGAGINVTMHAKEDPSESKGGKKKGMFLPLYLGGGS